MYKKPKPGEPSYIDVEGRRFELRYSLRTLKRLDRDEHISVLNPDGIKGLQDPTKLALILFYGISARNPEIDQEWVDDHIDASMLREMIPMLIYAMTGTWLDNSKNATSQTTSASETGLNSGLSDATTSAALN